jgi:hypothetical protein
VILGQAKGRIVDATHLGYVFRLRHLQRLVRPHGQIHLHHFGLYVDQGLQGQKVEVLIYDDVLRIEREDLLIVSYPCVYDARQRRITAVEEKGRHQYRRFQILQLKLFTLGMVRWVWNLPRYQRSQGPRRGFRRFQLNLFERLAEKTTQN